ncbi:MAG TPA: hypothetical protein VEQ63_12210 [Bryobacteraceae bacterium]|nr:hypothetical protein [Bryobacteraceae bacterium]
MISMQISVKASGPSFSPASLAPAAPAASGTAEGDSAGSMPAPSTLPVVPPVPESLEETGLPATFIEQLLLRTLYVRGEMVGRELARAVALRFSLIDPFLETFKRQQVVQVKRSSGIGNVSSYFSLSELGRQQARECMDTNQYVGPAPVPLEQYSYIVRRQKPPEGWLTKERLHQAYKRMVLTDDILDQVGPAVSSGHSFLIYGQPGNGKTFLAEALVNIDTTHIYMPYAIESQGAIIQVYDKLFHQVIEDVPGESAIEIEPAHDRRWFKCRRPFVVSGGELVVNMLDLSFNAVSKVYDAPLQLKANNGIYLIDDFGRQRATPAEVLNRWIVPMERHVDYLSLQSGGKITIPFEVFVVFSTNLRPDQLGDEAFLRRIHYKMHLRNPKVPEFFEIFTRFCESQNLACTPEVAERFIEKHYLATGKRMRRCHPRDVLSHARDLLNFEKLEPVLTNDILDRAFRSCFAEIGDMEA